VTERPADLRLAHLHLKTGSLALARAELEAMAGTAELDDDALLDLAEVRWRTGDLTGAGEAAEAFLARARTDPLAYVIAAEAKAALGRPTEARRLAGLAMEGASDRIDELFAGEPRSGAWPHDPADRGEPAGELFPTDGPSPASFGGVAAASSRGDVAPDASPDGATALERGRVALAAGDDQAAAVQLGIALRASPMLAPAVIDALAGHTGPALDLVRGDAYRLMGNEAEAQRAFASASRDTSSASEH
jgi:tetratricopeptide (TPR) repeat protein